MMIMLPSGLGIYSQKVITNSLKAEDCKICSNDSGSICTRYCQLRKKWDDWQNDVDHPLKSLIFLKIAFMGLLRANIYDHLHPNFNCLRDCNCL